MRISTNDTEQWALKQKFDKAFDDLFLKQDFAFHVCSILHRCPNGLDMDTLMEEDSKKIYFQCCCKKYGYDFSSSDRVIGDYYYGDDVTEEMLDICLDYMKEKNPVLYEEVIKYDIYY